MTPAGPDGEREGLTGHAAWLRGAIALASQLEPELNQEPESAQTMPLRLGFSAGLLWRSNED